MSVYISHISGFDAFTVTLLRVFIHRDLEKMGGIWKQAPRGKRCWGGIFGADVVNDKAFVFNFTSLFHVSNTLIVITIYCHYYTIKVGKSAHVYTCASTHQHGVYHDDFNGTVVQKFFFLNGMRRLWGTWEAQKSRFYVRGVQSSMVGVC